jgi:hypothetical protein
MCCRFLGMMWIRRLFHLLQRQSQLEQSLPSFILSSSERSQVGSTDCVPPGFSQHDSQHELACMCRSIFLSLHWNCGALVQKFTENLRSGRLSQLACFLGSCRRLWLSFISAENLRFTTIAHSVGAGKVPFTKKQADLFFPPDFADDFPVAMQVGSWFSLGFFVAPWLIAHLVCT